MNFPNYPSRRTLLLSSGEHRDINVDENWNFCQHCLEWKDIAGRFSSQRLKPYCQLFQKSLNVKRRSDKEYVPKRCDECLDADEQWKRYKELAQ